MHTVRPGFSGISHTYTLIYSYSNSYAYIYFYTNANKLYMCTYTYRTTYTMHTMKWSDSLREYSSVAAF